MYVGVTLLEAGHTICAPKPGPDFELTLDGRRLWIEAVAATPGEPGRPDSIPPLDLRLGMARAEYVPHDKIVLRCTSAISAKFPTQYRQHVEKGVIGPEDCYVIAVNHAQVYDYIEVGEPPYILRSVVGLGSHFVTIDRETGEPTGQGMHYRGSIPKYSGAPVETRLFLSSNSAPVSAIIGSVTSIGTPVHLPEHRMGQDFRLVHNPLATNALPTGLLVRGEEVHVSIRETQFEVSGRKLPN
jgi:type I restriction enzyme S subunit